VPRKGNKDEDRGKKCAESQLWVHRGRFWEYAYVCSIDLIISYPHNVLYAAQLSRHVVVPTVAGKQNAVIVCQELIAGSTQVCRVMAGEHGTELNYSGTTEG
jgi:hypothetical protein